MICVCMYVYINNQLTSSYQNQTGSKKNKVCNELKLFWRFSTSIISWNICRAWCSLHGMHGRSFSCRRLWFDFGYCQVKIIVEVTLSLYVNNTNYYLHIFYIIMNSFTFSELREILVSVQSCIEVLAVKIQVRSWYLFSLFSSLSMIICLLVA